MSCSESPMGISSVDSFPVWSGGSQIIFQLFGCRNLALNRMFSYIRGEKGGCKLRGHLYAPYMSICPLYLYAPYICMHPYPLYICMFFLYHMFPICHGILGSICTPHMPWGLLGGISTSLRHFHVC